MASKFVCPFYREKLKNTLEVVRGVDCAFSHIESPSEFYIHLVDEQCAIIDRLNEQICEICKNTTSEYSTKDEAVNAIGRFCFAYIEEYNSWFRVDVLDWHLDSKSEAVRVQLVDHGNKKMTSFKNLRKLTKAMADMPILAVKCHLPYMYPPGSTSLNRLTSWPRHSIDALLDTCGLFKNGNTSLFRITFADYVPQMDSMAIDLHNLNELEENTVGQILLDLSFAVQILDDAYDDDEVARYLQDVNELETADNINEAITGYDARDEARICRFANRYGTCFKGKNCKLEHVPLSKDGYTTDKEDVFREAMYSLELPSVGQYVTILITRQKDICSFFAQIIRNPHKTEQGYYIDASLHHLIEDMNHPKTVRTFQPFKIAPAIGEIALAKYWKKSWVRVVVRYFDYGDNGQPSDINVFALDYGDVMTVSYTELRKIPPRFLEIPFQAVECYIHNYKQRKGCDEDIARKFFTTNLYFHNFLANVMSSSLPLKIGLNSYNQVEIGKTLEEQGFAEERSFDIHPAEGCELQLY